MFMQENKEIIKKELIAQAAGGTFKPTLFLSEASKKWNSLAPERKQKYLDMAQKQKEAFTLQQVNEEGDEEF